MRRRGAWIKALIIRIVLVLAIGYAWLSAILPAWLHERLHQVVGEPLTMGQIRLGLPLKLILSDVRLAHGNPGTMISSDRIIVSPLWVSWPDRAIRLKRLELKGPYLRLLRTKQGTLTLPTLGPLAPSEASHQDSPAVTTSAPVSRWRVAVDTLQISEGTIEFVDAKPAQMFRAALTHLSFVGGPVSIPLKAQRITLALQGRAVGQQQHVASIYCSGWMNLQAKNLDVSCQLEPLRLAAFEPYYQGPLQVRAYDATLKAVGRFVAKANALDGRVQLEIGHLSEADLSFLGKTLVDIKEIASGSQPTLTGEIQISGSLDIPLEWRFQLVPGNEIVQRLVKPLLDRGVEIIRIRVGKQTIPVGLTPATEATKADSEAARQQAQEALEIIAPASPPPAEAPTSEPASQAVAPTPGPPEQPPATTPAISSPPPPLNPPAPQNGQPSTTPVNTDSSAAEGTTVKGGSAQPPAQPPKVPSVGGQPTNGQAPSPTRR